MEHPPEWLEIYHIGHLEPVALEGLDEEEASAIEVALFLRAELLLMDERAGTRVALAKGIPVTGTLGILDLSAELGLLNFAQAIEALKQTNFWRPIKLLESLLRKHREQLD